MPNCKNCSKEFFIYPEDKDFYNKIGVPEPTWCPLCREMRRWAVRNIKSLYPRQCDLCKKNIISVYPAQSELIVYCPECWWSDKWDGKLFAQDFDFSKPFFEQFFRLQSKVPRISNYNNNNSVNCDYSNAVIDCKNCYLLFSSARSEDCYYGYKALDCKDCVDNLNLKKSELCYQCMDSARCFNVSFSRFTYDSHDCAFLYNCSGCHDCFLCINLHNKEYCFLNQQLTPDEYNKKILDFKSGSHKITQKYLEEYKKMIVDSFCRFSEQHSSTNCVGDNLEECKNCFHCFNVVGGNGNRYGVDAVGGTTDCFDCSTFSLGSEMCFEGFSVGLGSYRIFCSTYCWSSSFLYYCDHFFGGGDNCFGCIGLKRGKFCILNKQYSEDGYNKLVPKIINHMKKTGEWGNFFPVESSLFAYNETMANDFFPLTKEEVRDKGWRWEDNLPGIFGKETVKGGDIPDSIEKVVEDFLKEVLSCDNCGRNYKIVKAEFDFYKKQMLPLPRICPDCRYSERFMKRNPHQLWHRQCSCELAGHKHQGRCTVEFETTYSPDRPEKIYCEECYQKEIY